MTISPPERRTILLADDDMGLLTLLGTTLGNAEFNLLQAGNGEEALQLAREHRPDLILLDINMPLLDGLEVCRQLKGDTSTAGIKVVLLTARASESDRTYGLRMGADAYFVKPFSPVSLLDCVYALLG